MDTPQEFAAKIIGKAGGPSALAKLVGVTRQRVHNWRERGIPYRVLHDHAETIERIRRKRTP
jgi:hypothetical protein